MSIPFAMNRLGGGLPYKKLQYLESTGTQWLALSGLTSFYQNNVNFDMKFAYYGHSSGDNVGYFFRFRKDNIITFCFCSDGLYSGAWSASQHISVVGRLTSLPQEFKLKTESNRASLDIDSTPVGYISSVPVQYINDATLYLFTWGGSSHFLLGRFYRLSFYNPNDPDDKYVDLIPVLDMSNRPCVYNTVSKQFFYNQGSGADFLYA